MRPKALHTMARAYQQICTGEDPWTALGNFKNAWYDYARDQRAALVSEPLGKPDRDTIVNRLYQNKYELNEWLQEARSKGMNNPRDIWRYARQKEAALHGA